MVSLCEIIFLYVYFFSQLRWKPFEIPKASQKKTDFVSVSQRLSTPSQFSPFFRGEWSSHLQADRQTEAALEAGSRHSTTCLCFGMAEGCLTYAHHMAPDSKGHWWAIYNISKQSMEIELLPSSGLFLEQRLAW